MYTSCTNTCLLHEYLLLQMTSIVFNKHILMLSPTHPQSQYKPHTCCWTYWMSFPCSLTQHCHSRVKYKSSLSQQSSGMQPIQRPLTQMPRLKRFGLMHGHQHFSRPQQQLSLINQCYFIDHLAGSQYSPAFYPLGLKSLLIYHKYLNPDSILWLCLHIANSLLIP